MSAPLLEARGLCAFYGATQVLFGLDLSVVAGGVTALLGANGAGKTTTLRALCGMVRTTGEIRLGGQSIVGRPIEDIVRLKVAHVPQGRGTFVRQTVAENLQIGAMSRGDHAAIAADKPEGCVCVEQKLQRAPKASAMSSGSSSKSAAMCTWPRSAP